MDNYILGQMRPLAREAYLESVRNQHRMVQAVAAARQAVANQGGQGAPKGTVTHAMLTELAEREEAAERAAKLMERHTPRQRSGRARDRDKEARQRKEARKQRKANR